MSAFRINILKSTSRRGNPVTPSTAPCRARPSVDHNRANASSHNSMMSAFS